MTSAVAASRLSFNQSINQSLVSIESYMPHSNVFLNNPPHSRSERALFDLGGFLSGIAFGLATQSDVRHVSEAMATVTDALPRNAHVLAKNVLVLVNSINASEISVSNLKHKEIN